MKKRFLGIICLLYSSIILYVWLSEQLKNFLAPNMQIYLKVSLLPMLIMSLIMLFNDKVNYKFKISDLVLILPIIMLILTQDGKLSMTLANNRVTNLNSSQKINNDENIEFEEETKIIEEDINNEQEEYDFSNPYFDVVDASYTNLSDYITYAPKAQEYVGKTIRVRGFTIKEGFYLKKGYFAIGKYAISCCVADADFTGFIAKYDMDKIKDNTWYEIEGVLENSKDSEDYDIMYIKVINIKEIDAKEEEQYVYPCYAYDNGSCFEISKYNLEY